jgi:hypothetical protein
MGANIPPIKPVGPENRIVKEEIDDFVSTWSVFYKNT